MAFSFAIISAVIAILIFRWFIKRRRFIKCLEKFPGPPPLPFIGNALDFASPTDILPKFLENKEKYGGIVRLWIGPSPNMLVIDDYDFLEYVHSSTRITDKSDEYRYLMNWLGTGLLVSKGNAKWKKHRKIITPTFHFQILEKFISIFEYASGTLVKKLEKEIGKSSFNIYPYISLCTLDIICETAMGTSINAQENSESEYVQSVKTMCRIVMERTFNPFLQYEIPYFFTKQYWQEKKAVKILHDYTNSVINKRRVEFENKQVEETEDEVGSKKKLAFLDLLLQENAKNQNLSDQDIREEVDTFMFEGHDTTASGISFAMFCLSENQEVQQKVVEELRSIFGQDKFRELTLKDLQEMKYLECVIKEVLRIYPSVPFYARNVHEDIEYAGGIIPKGVTLLIHAYGSHRNPKMFPEPEKFLPERFAIEKPTGRFPFAYIPFSAGPRNCIGQKYAMLEMKAVLSTLLRNYKVLPAEPKHNLVLSSEAVLLSKNGICVRLEERNF